MFYTLSFFSISPEKCWRCLDGLLIFIPWECVWKTHDVWYQSVSDFLSCAIACRHGVLARVWSRLHWDKGLLCCRASPLGTFISSSSKKKKKKNLHWSLWHVQPITLTSEGNKSGFWFLMSIWQSVRSSSRALLVCLCHSVHLRCFEH